MRHTLALLALLALGLAAPRPAAADDEVARYAPPFTPAWAAPQLHIEPADGPPGTWVLITGANFEDDVQVFYGDQPMAIVEVDDDRILAVVPDGYGPDFVYVIGDSGRARTAERFVMHGGRYDRFDHRERFDPYDRDGRHPRAERGWPMGWERPHDVPWVAPPPPDRW